MNRLNHYEEFEFEKYFKRVSWEGNRVSVW